MDVKERNKKIEEYERLGLFERDIEDDPPGREIMPDEIEYPKKGFLQRIKTKLAFFLAYRYGRRLIRKKILVVKEYVGVENLRFDGGCILTVNHFGAIDSFIMNLVFDESKRKGKIYRIIKEGNYTSFPGFYGFLMRNCNTLPLSQNGATMRKFLRGVDKLLKGGECVLIYPEQSMWQNYRKPKPLKDGAFDLAVRSGVPVVPCFITMEDTDLILGEERVQAHTVHIGKPIYPDITLSRKESVQKMKEENFAFNKSVYESFYNTPLEYLK